MNNQDKQDTLTGRTDFNKRRTLNMEVFKGREADISEEAFTDHFIKGGEYQIFTQSSVTKYLADVRKEAESLIEKGEESKNLIDEAKQSISDLRRLNVKMESGEVRTVFVKAKSEEIEEDETDEIEKGGEGSKGGKVIGHTKSGKPIYANGVANSIGYKDFTKEDHEDAYNKHSKISRDQKTGSSLGINASDKDKMIKQSEHHSSMSEKHKEVANSKFTKSNKEKVEKDQSSSDTDGFMEKGEVHQFEKGFVADQFSQYNNNNLSFEKTGKECKEKIDGEITALKTKQISLEEDLDEALENFSIDEKPKEKISSWSLRGFETKIKVPYKRFDYYSCNPNSDYKVMSENGTSSPKLTDEKAKIAQQYNQNLGDYVDTLVDIETLKFLRNNMEDKKKYKLTQSQLLSLGF